jgi:hypothetical protein
LLAFISVLRVYPQWREIWFVRVVIVEGGLFGAILYLLFGERKNEQPQTTGLPGGAHSSAL